MSVAMLEGNEMVVLSALMNGSPLLPVTADDFFSPPNRTIYNRIRGLTKRNLLAVTDALRCAGELEKVGGAHRITEIATLPHDAENLEYALGEVLAASRQRHAAKIGEKLCKGGITPDEAQEQLSKLKQSRERRKSWADALNTAAVTSSQLRNLKLTPRQKLLGDWLCEGDLGFIFAFRGTGKTWLSLAIAQAISTGGKLGDWQSHKPVKVLYLDSEMPPDLMRDRSEGLETNDNLLFVNHDILFERSGMVLNITHPETQQAITELCIKSGAKVLFIDNLSTCTSGMKENEADSWELVNNWLLDFRRRKIAVVIVHHAGRSGEMRGTSKREDAAFWVIALDDVKKHSDDKRGARFVSRFTKPSRNSQEDVSAYKWHFVTEPSGEVTISCEKAQTLDVFRQLIEEGVSECNHIATEMKITPGAVSKLAKKAMDAGWLKKVKREYVLMEGAKT